MSITPKGMSIQEAYRQFRENKFFVNRKYQRKLVWTLEEKQGLIDSIIRDYPIPLFLLAETKDKQGTIYEIMDGVQRLNAIFSFIENAFAVEGKYFNVGEYPRAKQVADSGIFIPIPAMGNEFLSPEIGADILDYQLAVTVFPIQNEDQVTDVFGRINAGGKQLSSQEKRQAGMIDDFSTLVRQLASEIRGDASPELLSLANMPEISIDSSRRDMGYSLKADDVFWCFQGILNHSGLRNSEDEEMIADICASIISGKPLAASKDLLDDLYDENSAAHEEVLRQLNAYGFDRLNTEMKVTLSAIKSVIENSNPKNNALRSVINPGSSNPIKAAFFALFIAFHDLVIKEEKTPDSSDQIMSAIDRLQNAMIVSAHYTKVEDREKNIAKTKGLVQRFFVKKDPPMLRHGAGLALDLENSLRRSKVETSRYECKQGFLDLVDKGRKINMDLQQRLLETMCAIANVGPDSDGYIFIGVADNLKDAERVKQIYGTQYIKVGDRFVVGVDREINDLGIDYKRYVEEILKVIRESQLADQLKSQILAQVDNIDYKGLSIIRIRIPKQTQLSFLGETAFIRENESTRAATQKEIAAITGLFK